MRKILCSLAVTSALTFLAPYALAEGNKTQSSNTGNVTAIEPSAGDPTMRIHLDASGMQQLQQSLNSKGYTAGQTDGIWSAQTSSAVRKFQEDNNLEVTGTVNSETATTLGLNTDADTPSMRHQTNSPVESNDDYSNQ